MASKGSTFDTIDLDLKAWPQSDIRPSLRS
jgi:hypothetical protein